MKKSIHRKFNHRKKKQVYHVSTPRSDSTITNSKMAGSNKTQSGPTTTSAAGKTPPVKATTSVQKPKVGSTDSAHIPVQSNKNNQEKAVPMEGVIATEQETTKTAAKKP